MNLSDIYAASDPEGWDACRASGRAFKGGSLYTNEPTGLDFEIALAALAGEEVSLSEAVSAVDLMEHALDHLDRQYGLGEHGPWDHEPNDPPKYGPYRYIHGAAQRLRKARNQRRRVA